MIRCILVGLGSYQHDYVGDSRVGLTEKHVEPFEFGRLSDSIIDGGNGHTRFRCEDQYHLNRWLFYVAAAFDPSLAEALSGL